MESIKKIQYKEQWLLFYAINILFICKYMSRTSYNPFIGIGIFTILCAATFVFYNYISNKKNIILNSTIITLLVFATILISLILIKIEPLSVNVDRWSATTYFLNGLFSGEYPYAIHTHVCETNYPSPFPLWYYINIPFWLMGDVGIGLIFFLLFFTAFIYWFTKSDKRTLLILLLLLISPAYWWEVIVRSDGLSNAILLFSVILFFYKRNYSFSNHWILTAIICGFMGATRLYAPIAPAIYLAKSFFKAPLLRQISILSIILLIIFLFFAPYIFWDVENWIFFKRNPFMSETSTGNGGILCIMILLALFFAYKYKTIIEYTRYTALFWIIFFAVSLIYNHLTFHSDIAFFEDADFDISYFSLALPYILFTISQGKIGDEKLN